MTIMEVWTLRPDGTWFVRCFDADGVPIGPAFDKWTILPWVEPT